jgi:hypothetical protein
MSAPVPDYTPPDSTTMATRQNQPQALRLLLAQRRSYSRAKWWLGLRWFGMLTIGLAAPLVSVINPDLAVVAGAVAGLWLFLGRTLLVYVQSGQSVAAAAIQEKFDFLVFGMPASVPRSVMPTLEEITALTGPDETLDSTAEKENLKGWYPFDLDKTGLLAVAIAQRANAAYSGLLLRTTAKLWAVVTVVWIIALVVLSVMLTVPLSAFLLGVLFPVLPAGLDVVEYIGRIRTASRERNDLASSIEASLHDPDDELSPSDLLVWQEQLFHLRKIAPDVPDFIYKLTRSRNERSMRAVAEQLGPASSEE